MQATKVLVEQLNGQIEELEAQRAGLAEDLQRRNVAEAEAAARYKSDLAELEQLNRQTSALDRAYVKALAPFLAASAALVAHERTQATIAASIQRYCDSHEEATGVAVVPSAHALTIQASGELDNYERFHNLSVGLLLTNNGRRRTVSARESAALERVVRHFTTG